MSAAAIDLTWVGHATTLIDVDGRRIMTDPLLTRRVGHLRRRRPVPPADHHDIDIVLLSHVHMDHLHVPSLKRLRPTARVFTPAGSAQLLRRAGFGNVTEVSVGDRIDTGSVVLDVVPADHRHGRGPHSRVTARPVGYVVETGDRRIYFPGDTDLFPEMAELGAVDVALLPIWGWGSSLGEGHLNPERAAQAAEIIRPDIVVPIHWGTYAPEDARRRLPPWFDTPPVQLADALDGVDVATDLRVLEPGGRVRLT